MFSAKWMGVVAWAFLAVSAACFSRAAGQRRVELLVPGGYLSGVPTLVRVEVVDERGLVDRGLWDATARLSVDQPGVTLSTDQVRLYNGLGSALVRITGSGDLRLSAEVNGLEASRQLVDLQGRAVTEVSGTLAGQATTWSGIVHVTGEVVVPAGHTLTVEPGTLVLVNGVDSGSDGTDIDVRGTVEALGTPAEPITFTASEAGTQWGRINLEDGGPSVFRYTNITAAGRSGGAGHTGAGLVINCENTTVGFYNCSITDHHGKIMYSRRSELTFSRCHLARAVMGPETETTAVLFEDSHITQMHGTDDNDAIYLRGQSAGQQIILRRGVAADCDDDGIDTLGSSVVVEDFIVRDVYDKGLSINAGGPIRLRNMLIVNNGTGVAAKIGSTSGVVEVYIDNATVVSRDTGRSPSDIGIHAYFKYSTSGTVKYFIANSIILAADPVVSDFGDLDPLVRIDYSCLSEPWPGTGNIVADPCFADAAGGDYHLKSQAGRPDNATLSWVCDELSSPCIDAGDIAAPIGLEPFPNGGVINMGAYGGTAEASKSYFGREPCETVLAGDLNGDCLVDWRDFGIMAVHWGQDNNP